MVLNRLKAEIRTKILLELTTILLVSIVSLIFFSHFDILEWLVKTSQRHEYFDLDELISASIVLCLLLGIFSYRRWQDVRKLSLYCEELSMIDPITMLPNRRVIMCLLDDIRQGNKKNDFPLSLVLVDIHGFKTIQAKIGNDVAEQVGQSLSNKISELLSPTQLMTYASLGQCLIYCPELDSEQAHILSEKLSAIKPEGQQTILSDVIIHSVSITITQAKELDWALERLEDLLFESRAKARKMEEITTSPIHKIY